MDIAAMSMYMSQVNLQNDVSTAVLRKTLDTVNAEAAIMTDALSSMGASRSGPSLESLVNPNMGTAIDISV